MSDYKEEGKSRNASDAFWKFLSEGTGTGLEDACTDENQTLLVFRGDKKAIEEAKTLLDQQSRLKGVEVAKW